MPIFRITRHARTAPHRTRPALRDTARANGIAKPLWNHYTKWLRYYLDFCHRYGHALNEQQSFPPFDEKLRAKHQSESQRQQARQALSLYYGLAKTDLRGGQISVTSKPGHLGLRNRLGRVQPGAIPRAPSALSRRFQSNIVRRLTSKAARVAFRPCSSQTPNTEKRLKRSCACRTGNSIEAESRSTI